jgi:hypothetical protein
LNYLSHVSGDSVGQNHLAFAKRGAQGSHNELGSEPQGSARITIYIYCPIDHEMQVLAPKSAQLSKGRHDLVFNHFARAKNLDAVFLAKSVEISASHQLLRFLRERIARECRLHHLKAPQRDHLTDESCLGDTRHGHPKDVTLLRF